MGKFADRYKTDRTLEEGGVWVDFGDGVEVKMRRLQSEFSRDIRRQLEKPYENLTRGGRSLPDNILEELMNKQLARAVIVDWKGVEDEAGKTVPYSEENVIKIMSTFRDFREDVLTAAMTAVTFQNEEKKAAEGNSKNASSGA